MTRRVVKRLTLAALVLSAPILPLGSCGGGDDEPDAPQRRARRTRADLSRGERLFVTYCSQCHGVTGHGVRPLVGQPFTVVKLDGTDEDVERIMANIRTGAPESTMPAFAEYLSEDQIRTVAEHVLKIVREGQDEIPDASQQTDDTQATDGGAPSQDDAQPAEPATPAPDGADPQPLRETVPPDSPSTDAEQPGNDQDDA